MESFIIEIVPFSSEKHDYLNEEYTGAGKLTQIFSIYFQGFWPSALVWPNGLNVNVIHFIIL